MGVALERGEDTYTVITTGGGFGYLVTMRWLPEYGIGVVILTNSGDHPQIDNEIAGDLLRRIVKDAFQNKIDDPSIPTSDALFSTASSLKSPNARRAHTGPAGMAGLYWNVKHSLQRWF